MPCAPHVEADQGRSFRIARNCLHAEEHEQKASHSGGLSLLAKAEETDYVCRVTHQRQVPRLHVYAPGPSRREQHSANTSAPEVHAIRKESLQSIRLLLRSQMFISDDSDGFFGPDGQQLKEARVHCGQRPTEA